MSIHFLTMIPTSGDGPYPGSASVPGSNWTNTDTPEPSFDYISKIALAREAGGFDFKLSQPLSALLLNITGHDFTSYSTTSLKLPLNVNTPESRVKGLLDKVQVGMIR